MKHHCRSRLTPSFLNSTAFKGTELDLSQSGNALEINITWELLLLAPFIVELSKLLLFNSGM